MSSTSTVLDEKSDDQWILKYFEQNSDQNTFHCIARQILEALHFSNLDILTQPSSNLYLYKDSKYSLNSDKNPDFFSVLFSTQLCNCTPTKLYFTKSSIYWKYSGEYQGICPVYFESRPKLFQCCETKSCWNIIAWKYDTSLPYQDCFEEIPTIPNLTAAYN